MCGGSLEVSAGTTIIECEYCGTKQTLPKTTDENIQSLFNRANLLRQKNEFDKAEAVYEKILEADDTESEAYWGVILCKFGIEYVEDPKTYKRIPTCHRTSYDSIAADEYFKKAIEHADITQRTMYESEAKTIDDIQKGVLAISSQEDPYDVFICYKETDESGKRTQDSVIANEIYYELKQEGFKVFYAAITLEDKLGSAYEPIIFAALNSSKVMLAIGTKPEYFDSVWVKNEWSRFLKMMKKNRSKMLIPCYKGMDAYELPEEFAHLQAQDMGKIGFITDIVRGIKKVIAKDKPKQTVVKETVVTSANPTVDPLLKRVFMFLEDSDWESAEEYCERVLDIDPENARAYVGKLMVDLEVKKQEALKDYDEPFDDNNNYRKALRFANETLSAELQGYINSINERNEQKRIKGIYDRAHATKNLKTYVGYSDAASLFKSLGSYLDSEQMVEHCLERAEECRKNEVYRDAKEAVKKGTSAGCMTAITLFSSIPGWKDADEQVAICKERLPELKEKEQAERNERIRKEEENRKRAALEQRKNSMLSSLDRELNSLTRESDSLVVTRKSTLAPIGYFFAFCAIFMCVIGALLFSLDDDQYWPFIVGAIEFLIAFPLLRKTPSGAVVRKNKKRKQELYEESQEVKYLIRRIRNAPLESFQTDKSYTEYLNNNPILQRADEFRQKKTVIYKKKAEIDERKGTYKKGIFLKALCIAAIVIAILGIVLAVAIDDDDFYGYGIAMSVIGVLGAMAAGGFASTYSEFTSAAGVEKTKQMEDAYNRDVKAYNDAIDMMNAAPKYDGPETPLDVRIPKKI